MSARAAQCPNCGAEVLFSAGSSVVTICRQCRSAVARKGVNLEAIGVVADLVPTSSPFKVGMRSRGSKSVKPFTIVGRLQLSTGEGTWDEWHVAFGDGGYAWLAEAQGGFWMMLPLKPPPVPEWTALAPGQSLDLGAYGRYAIAEVREATYVSAEGDLPFAAPPGSVFRYADISGGDGSLGTLDYGDDPGLDGFYVGRRLELADLGIEGLTAWKDRKSSAKAQALNCPNCGGALELKDAANTVRVACSHCGSLLGGKAGDGPPDKFEVLTRLSTVPFRPAIPPGAEGTLNGHAYAVLGALHKATTSDGTTYYWDEYLLKEEKTEAYHWLAESNGHFTLLEPVPAGAVEASARYATYKGTRYRIFSRSHARVDAVVGEFYWAVKKGEATVATDYVAPPRMLSCEEAQKEVAWTEGLYVPREDVAAAFPAAALPAQSGVGAVQPWSHEGTSHLWWKTARILALAAIAVFIVAKVTAPNRIVFDKTYDLVDAARLIYAERGSPAAAGGWAQQTAPAPAPAATPRNPVAAREAKEEAEAAQRVILSDPFETPRTANLEAVIWSPTDNSWVDAGVSLIAEGTGEARSFSLVSDRYHGVDGGESWSEGQQSRTVWVSRVPAGKWVARIDPETEQGHAPPQFRIRLTSGVPHLSHLIWTLVLLFVPPFLLVFSKLSWEGRRWAESDFTQAGAGRGSEDSGSDSDE
ncbi:MAG TPA: DUF4178 domain-containing protein [Thermoanaerobaculia bacterium]|nr:DUF4178 domain-containing protein [Thermoanaerobaculia bacterium]